MPYTVSGTDIRGVNTARRRTPESALKKAREFIARACYDVRITTPEGRTYHSAEFGDLPRTPAARQPAPKHAPARQARPAAALAKVGETSQGSSLFQKKPA